MVRSIRAIYESGVFRPLEDLSGLPDRTPVQLRVEEVNGSMKTLADFAGRWSAVDADAIAAIIEREFERVIDDPRECAANGDKRPIWEPRIDSRRRAHGEL